MERFRYFCQKCKIEFLSIEKEKCPSCQSADHLFTIVAAMKKNDVPGSSAAATLISTGGRAIAEAVPVSSPRCNILTELSGQSAQSFELLIRELISEREEFEELVNSAMRNTTQLSDLRKLLSVLIKFSKMFADVRASIKEKFDLMDGNVHVNSAKPIFSPALADTLTNEVLTEGAFTDKNVQPVAAALSMKSEPQSFSSSKEEKLPEIETESEDLNSVRVVFPRTNILEKITSKRICLPSLNPETTEESLEAFFISLGFTTKSITLHKWAKNRSRGVAVVLMEYPKQAAQLVAQNNLIIDGWAVSPRLLLEDEQSQKLTPVGAADLESLSLVSEPGDRAEKKQNLRNKMSAETVSAQLSQAPSEVVATKRKRQLKAERRKQAQKAREAEPRQAQEAKKPGQVPKVLRKIILMEQN